MSTTANTPQTRLTVFSLRELCAQRKLHFGILPQGLRTRKDLSNSAKVMYSALAEMEATMPEVRPSINRLAAEVGGSRSAAIRALNELRAKQLIEVIEQPRKGVSATHSTNIYRFLLNPDFFPEFFKASAGNDTSIENDTSSISDTSSSGSKNSKVNKNNNLYDLASVKNDTSSESGTSVKNGQSQCHFWHMSNTNKQYQEKKKEPTAAETPIQQKGDSAPHSCRKSETKPDTDPAPQPVSPKNPGLPGSQACWEKFWEAYPVKEGMESAFRAFLSLWGREIPDAEYFENEVMPGLRRWKRSQRWADDDGKYIPKAVTFLIGNASGKNLGHMWKDYPRESDEVKSKRKLPGKSSDGVNPLAIWEPDWPGWKPNGKIAVGA